MVWSAEEDAVLISTVMSGDAAGATRTASYTAAAAALPGRSIPGIEQRVRRLKMAGKLPVTTFRFVWTPTEDDALIAAVNAADAAGRARREAYTDATATLIGRSADAIEQRARKLIAAGRLASHSAPDGAPSGSLLAAMRPIGTDAAAAHAASDLHGFAFATLAASSAMSTFAAMEAAHSAAAAAAAPYFSAASSGAGGPIYASSAAGGLHAPDSSEVALGAAGEAVAASVPLKQANAPAPASAAVEAPPLTGTKRRAPEASSSFAPSESDPLKARRRDDDDVPADST